jgi:hypothetical protein
MLPLEAESVVKRNTLHSTPAIAEEQGTSLLGFAVF